MNDAKQIADARVYHDASVSEKDSPGLFTMMRPRSELLRSRPFAVRSLIGLRCRGLCVDHEHSGLVSCLLSQMRRHVNDRLHQIRRSNLGSRRTAAINIVNVEANPDGRK